MNTPHVILRMVMLNLAFSVNLDCTDIIECDDEDFILVFKSFDEAKLYQDKFAIDGQVIPLPIY